MELSFINSRTDHVPVDFLNKYFRKSCFALFAVTVTLCASPTFAADTSNQTSAKSAYQRDRAMCNKGQSNQDRATCLKEAAAAYGETRRGQLNDGQAQYNLNALERCNALPPEDMKACQRRINGEGISEGSAQEGGIYRKIETPTSTPHNHSY